MLSSNARIYKVHAPFWQGDPDAADAGHGPHGGLFSLLGPLRDLCMTLKEADEEETEVRMPILQVYRHPTGIQTSHRYTDILHVCTCIGFCIFVYIHVHQVHRANAYWCLRQDDGVSPARHPALAG